MLGLGFSKAFGPARAFDPGTEASTVGWFRASDLGTLDNPSAAVGSWTNKKGSASAATASGTARPLSSIASYNGINGLRFDGADDKMDITIPAMSAMTIFVIGRSMVTTPPTNNSQVIVATKNSGGASGFAINGKVYSSSSDRSLSTEGTVSGQLVYKNGYTSGGTALNQGELFCAMGQYASGGSQTTLRLCAYLSNNFNGQHDIFEVIIYNGAISADLKFKTEYYIESRYGLNMNARPSWVFTKTGQEITRPAAMTSGNGTYYPCIVSMKTVPNFPADYAVYFSTDHAAGAGGIYLYLVTGDPSNPANFQSYDDAKAAGKFNYLSSKPAANPIYVDTVAGNQTETPQVINVGGTLVLTYQNAGVGNNQSTVRALGTDGVNFTRDTVVVDYANGTSVGDGHTGYLKWGLNPFPGVPYKYVGYSLHGGQSKPYMAQWGCNDPTTELWTQIAVMQRVAGRAAQGSRVVEWNTFDVQSVQKVPQGYSALCDMEQASAGAAARDGAVYEILLDDTGRQVIGVPQQVLAKGSSGAFDEGEVQITGLINLSDRFAGVYNGASSANAKTVGGAYALKRNLAATKFLPLTPVVPAYTETKLTLSSYSGTPSGMTLVTSGAPSIAYTANGVEMTGNTGTPDDEAYLFFNTGFLPNSLTFIELWVEDWSTLSADRNRIPYVGFASSMVAPASITDGFYFNNGGSTDGASYGNKVVASVLSTNGDGCYNGVGYNSGQCTAPKRLGIRWFPASGRFFTVGESGHECNEWGSNGDGINKALTYYPFFGFRSKGVSVKERFRVFGVRYGS